MAGDRLDAEHARAQPKCRRVVARQGKPEGFMGFDEHLARGGEVGAAASAAEILDDERAAVEPHRQVGAGDAASDVGDGHLGEGIRCLRESSDDTGQRKVEDRAVVQCADQFRRRCRNGFGTFPVEDDRARDQVQWVRAASDPNCADAGPSAGKLGSGIGGA